MEPGKERILALIAEQRPRLQALEVQRIGLFGSFARGEEGAASDVDLLVQFRPGAHIGLFEFVGLRSNSLRGAWTTRHSPGPEDARRRAPQSHDHRRSSKPRA